MALDSATSPERPKTQLRGWLLSALITLLLARLLISPTVHQLGDVALVHASSGRLREDSLRRLDPDDPVGRQTLLSVGLSDSEGARVARYRLSQGTVRLSVGELEAFLERGGDHLDILEHAVARLDAQERIALMGRELRAPSIERRAKAASILTALSPSKDVAALARARLEVETHAGVRVELLELLLAHDPKAGLEAWAELAPTLPTSTLPTVHARLAEHLEQHPELRLPDSLKATCAAVIAAVQDEDQAATAESSWRLLLQAPEEDFARALEAAPPASLSAFIELFETLRWQQTPEQVVPIVERLTPALRARGSIATRGRLALERHRLEVADEVDHAAMLRSVREFEGDPAALELQVEALLYREALTREELKAALQAWIDGAAEADPGDLSGLRDLAEGLGAEDG